MNDMSRSEAIEVLKDIISKPVLFSNHIIGACRIALASLETDEAYQLEYERTTKNCESCRYYGLHHEVCNYCYKCSLWTEQESTTKNDLGVDAVRRKAVLNTLDNMDSALADEDRTVETYKELLKECYKVLPSVTPIRPKGHWICDGKGRSFADYHCSECGLKLALCGQDIKQRQDSGYSLFCGGCGADMREVVEE